MRSLRLVRCSTSSTPIPGLTDARMLLLQAYESAGYWEEAAGMVREELRASPDSAPLYCRLGVILQQQKKTDAGARCFREFVEARAGQL